MNKLLVICGPTATGKTKLAVQLAKKFNGELISADSRQVYKGMDIGTGKDLTEFSIYNFQFSKTFKGKNYNLGTYAIACVPIWMYDVVNPDEEFSVSHYIFLASAVIENITQRGKLPVLVGGTGLYIKGIVEGIPTGSIPRSDELRKKLNALSLQELQLMIKEKAPQTWSMLNHSDRMNPRRLIRKLEIAFSDKRQDKMNIQEYDTLHVGLTMPKNILQDRISLRVHKRVDQGILEEIKALLEHGYSFDLPSLNTLGYKEWKDYMSDTTEENKSKAIADWTADEVHYSKKQMTWFRKQPGILWFDIAERGYQQKVEAVVSAWYTHG